MPLSGVLAPNLRTPAAALLAIVLAALSGCGRPAPPSIPVVWAWERPEDLRFLPAGAEVAVQTGFLVLSGRQLIARGRRAPLRARPDQVTTAVVHVQIDRGLPLLWSPALEQQTAEAILDYGARAPVRRLQVDFEVRASERPILLAVLRRVRQGLPAKVALSMTALAAWCETERWLGDAPVDEVAPMLFRMGPDGDAIKAELAAGGDFAEPRCRTALAIAVDTPIARAPPGRRVYLFDSRAWTSADYASARREIGRWGGRGD